MCSRTSTVEPCGTWQYAHAACFPVGEGLHGVTGADVAAQLTQAGGERVGERLRAAARKRPAGQVREPEQHRAEAGTAATREREDGVRRSAEEESTRVVAVQTFREAR